MIPTSSAARIEVLLVLLVPGGVGLWLAARGGGAVPVSTGNLILWLCLAFFIQTLLRDGYLLWTRRGESPIDGQGGAMCLESLVGVAALLVGIVLVFLPGSGGLPGTVHMSAMGWALALWTVLLLGYGLRDWVVRTRPLRLRRDPDHINLLVWPAAGKGGGS